MTLIQALESELTRVQAERQRLGTRQAHLQAALIRAQHGVNARIIRETLGRLGVEIEEPEEVTTQ